MTRDYASTAAVGALLALALTPLLWPTGAAAHTCDHPFSTDLVTAKGIDVGDVKVCNDAELLTVTYETTYPWCLLKTNLHVAADLAGIPKTFLRTPNWPKFDYGDRHDCEGEVAFEIPLADIDGGVEPEDTVTIAARAVVEGEGVDWRHPRCLLGDKCVAWGDGTRFRPRLPATYFTYEVEAPPTSCVCDSRLTSGGTSGAAILAQLCPAGVLGPGVTFEDDPDVVGPIVPDFVSLYQVSGPSGPSADTICAIKSRLELSGFSFPLASSEAEACRAHLRASCGRPEP